MKIGHDPFYLHSTQNLNSSGFSLKSKCLWLPMVQLASEVALKLISHDNPGVTVVMSSSLSSTSVAIVEIACHCVM